MQFLFYEHSLNAPINYWGSWLLYVLMKVLVFDELLIPASLASPVSLTISREGGFQTPTSFSLVRLSG